MSEQAVVSVVLLAILVLLVLVTLWKAVRVVPAGRAGLVERLGRFTRVAPPGLNLVAPFVDKVRVVDLREQVATFAHPMPALSGGWVRVDGRVLYAVADPAKAVYQNDRPYADLALAALRDLVARLPADEVKGRSRDLEADLWRALQLDASRSGVEPRKLEITAVQPASPTSTGSSGR